MAKPRVFVSSTYYDLRHIRNNLEGFIDNLGYEAVLFESGDIPFHPDSPLDVSCYEEIEKCHILVLIIGGRYGSPSSDSLTISGMAKEEAYEAYSSITRKEYETARSQDIPVFIFVEKSVLAEYQTYRSNRENETVKYRHVDSVNVFRLLDDIHAQKRNNFVREFEKADDITTWLRDQWAGLFADFLARRTSETTLRDMASQISNLRQVSSTLKTYTESIMRAVDSDDSESIIEREEKRLRAARRVEAFGKERLIRALFDIRQGPVDLPALYQMFLSTDSFQKFLEGAGVDEIGIQVFVHEGGEATSGVYEDLKRRYSNT